MAITRANPHLAEIIEILDIHRSRYKNDDEARAYLSKDDNLWIDNEVFQCITNTRYFISNYYAYRDEQEGFKGLYPLFDSQEILHNEYRRLEKTYGKVMALVLKARQMGSTTYNCAEFFHKTIFAEHVNSIIVGQDEDQSTFIMGMYESALDFIPWWMRPRIKQQQTGSLINFDEKDETLRQTHPGLKTWVYADNANKPTGVGRGKCQVPWTYVWTADGPKRMDGLFGETCSIERMTVDDEGGEWYTPDRDVFTWAFNGNKMERRRITRIYRQQYHGDIQRIGVANGVLIEKTPEHQLLCAREWKNQISIGDHIDCVKNLEWMGRKSPQKEFVELMAWQIAEGCESQWNTVTITQKNEEIRKRIALLVKAVTGNNPINRRGEDLKRVNSVGYVTFADPNYKNTLRKMGYEWGNRSARKKIPDDFFTWDKESIAVFLRAFFEAEGSVSDKVEIVTASRQVAESLRMMCAAFGISLRVRECIKYAANTKNKIRRTYYRGNISGPCMQIFAREIGFLSERKNGALQSLAAKTNGYTLKQYPHLTEMFRTACIESGTPFKKILGEARKSTTQNFSHAMAVKALTRMDEIVRELPKMYPSGVHHSYRKCNQKLLGEWADKIRIELRSELCQEKIESTSVYEYDGFIYDLEVEGVHNYPTCGVVTHNTFGRSLLSELSFWKNASQLSKSLFPTFNTPNGFYIMESTANGRNDAWHNLWRRAEAGKVEWQPIFIPFYRRAKTYSLPILKTEVFVLSEDEKEMRERVFKKESFLISDPTFKWMRNKKETFIAVDGDDSMFSQEYTSEPEESFQSSAITAFPRGIIRKFSRLTKNPRWIGEIRYDEYTQKPKLNVKEIGEADDVPYPESENRFHIWKMAEKGATYCLGCDVALGNEGGDYSCVQVIRLSHGHERDEQVACWHGLINPTAYAGIIVAIGLMYNEALVAVEVNSFGISTNSLIMRQYEYENIYRFKHLDRMKNFMTFITGFLSTPKSCDALMARMSEAFLEDTIIINDKFTMDEFNDYTEEGAKGEGAHDDMVDALQIALFCGHEGEVLERQSGTKPHKPKDAEPNKFFVKNRDGVLMLTTSDQNQAERAAAKIIGSQIIRNAGATAELQRMKKVDGEWTKAKVRIPSDFQNTDSSPIHDKPGTAHRLHYEENVPEELITPEMIAEAELLEDEAESDPNAWMYN